MKNITRTSVRILTGSIVASIALLAGSAQAALITYTFPDLGSPTGANLEGWTSVFPANVDIWADYTGYFGPGLPVDGGHLGDGFEDVDTQLAHSPAFNLDGSGDMTWQMFGTASPVSTPTSLTSAGIGSTALTGTGFMGVALRDVLTDTYVLWSAWPGTVFAPVAAFSDASFTTAQLTPYANDGRAYTLDFIDNSKAPGVGDNWVTLGGATIPGAVVPEPTTAALGGLGLLALLRRRRNA